MDENMLKLNSNNAGLVEVKEVVEEEPEERLRKEVVLYRKQIKLALPGGARIGKNVIVNLNNEFSEQLEVVLRLAFKECQSRNRKTISGNDVKLGFVEYKKTNATFILDVLENTILNKIKEMKETCKGVD